MATETDVADPNYYANGKNLNGGYMSANRQYKSSVFATLFGEPDRFIELYNALTGSAYPLTTNAEPATLTDILFMDRQNDVAFVIGDTIVVLIEHQSSISKNMALRLFLYIARVYELIIENEAIYKERLYKIPKPEFIVLYNGTDNYPDEETLRLSDAFMRAPQPGLGGHLELTVRVVNINKGHNSNIINSSNNLKGYVEFIALVRRNRQLGLSLQDAVTKAVEDCIQQGVLVNFLQRHATEVINMLTAEFSIDTAKRVWQEEAREEANIQKAIKDVVIIVKKWHISLKDAMALLELDKEYLQQVITELKRQNVEYTE